MLDTSKRTQSSESNNEEDKDSNPITCPNDSQLENTQVILDVRESIEAMETMETYLTPSFPVTEPQDKSTRAVGANNLAILFQSLERKLLTSLQDLNTNALSSLTVHVEGEIQALRENFRILELRITKLEQVDKGGQQSPCFVPISKDIDEAPTTLVSEFSAQIEKKVAQLMKTIEKQQKTIENAEREKKEQNVIIVGLNESEMNTETMIMSFFEEKLNIILSPPPITNTKRLGHKNEECIPKTSPCCLSNTRRQEVMKRKKLLAGTRVYINNDLTK